MSIPREIPPVGGSLQAIVDYGIRSQQQEVNIAVQRKKDLELEGQLKITGQVASAATSPDAIQVDQNDYVVLGVGSARSGILRLSPSAAFNITGLLAREDEFLRIINVGVADVILNHENFASKAKNRILIPGSASVNIEPNGSTELWYDTVSKRWRVMGCSGLRDYDLEASRGLIPGVVGVNKYGRTTNADTGVSTFVWDRANVLYDQPTWIAPTAARIHDIASTSPLDAVGLGGASLVRVYGLQTWFSLETFEDVPITGVVNSPTVKAYVILHRMKVIAPFGSGVDPNIGTVIATARVDNTRTAQIEPGEGQTHMAIFGVGSTQTFYMDAWEASINKQGSAGAADMSIVFNADPANTPLTFISKHTTGLSTAGTSSYSHPFKTPKIYPGPGIIAVMALTNALNFDVSAGFDGKMVVN